MIVRLIKNQVGNSLRRQGYIISKPTDIERNYKLRLWSDIIAIDPLSFAQGYLKNRETLASVKEWIERDALDRSLWRYGIPKEWESHNPQYPEGTGINEIEKEPTHADLISFLGRDIPNLTYLEIGVSVGKNFLQVCRQFPKAEIVGLDVEEVYSVLRDQFSEFCVTFTSPEERQVATLGGRPVNKRATMSRLGSVIHYLSADQFCEETWELLKPRKFNIVFSDGVHSAVALRRELDFLLKYDLIDRSRFAMIWDDLFGIEMQAAFLDNAKQLSAIFSGGSYGILKVQGSYGVPRPVGLFRSKKK